MSSTTSSQQHLISRAKEGDTTALNALINQTLAPLGVVVTSVLNAECLIVTAVIPNSIDRLFLIKFMREGMERLQAQSIQQVTLVGRDRERMAPDWQYTLNLHQADLPPTPTKKRKRVIRMATATPDLASQPPVAAPTKAKIKTRHWLLSRPLNFALTVASGTLLICGTFAAKTVFLVDHSLDRQIDFLQEIAHLESNTATTSIDKLALGSVDYLRDLKTNWCSSPTGIKTVLAKGIGMGLFTTKPLAEERQELAIAADPQRRFTVTTTAGETAQTCIAPLTP
jgi:hypothetical protein